MAARPLLITALLCLGLSLSACGPQRATRQPCPAGARCLEFGNTADPISLDPQIATAINEKRGMNGMNTYVILRRSGWRSPEDLQEAAARSTVVGEEMPDDIRWIRSYVLEEDGGSVGTVCIYQASSVEAVHEHAQRARLPVDEVIAVADTVLVRPDPAAASA